MKIFKYDYLSHSYKINNSKLSINVLHQKITLCIKWSHIHYYFSQSWLPYNHYNIFYYSLARILD